MPRPVILGVVGDSAAGKTTITRGLLRILGEDRVTHVCTDDYHRYDRKQRADLGINPAAPCLQPRRHRRAGPRAPAGGRADPEAGLKHADGTFGLPVHVTPKPFTVVEGLLGYHAPDMRDCYDVRVYLAPAEDLRRRWKVQRDCSRRGYTTDQVLTELDRREPDSAQFIRPQECYADVVVSFREGDDGDPHSLEAELVLRDGLSHPDLSPVVGGGDRGITIDVRGSELLLSIAGDIEREQAAEIEEAIWEKLHFASHLRSERLGEFTIGDDVHRSESLGVVQLLILYHVVTAKAAIATGSAGTRPNGSEHPPPATAPEQQTRPGSSAE